MKEIQIVTASSHCANSDLERKLRIISLNQQTIFEMLQEIMRKVEEQEERKG